MATKQEQIDFVKKVYPAAKNLNEKSPNDTLHPLFVTAQAALETGWRIGGIQNNLFGITKGSWTGQTKLVLTTEYFQTPDKKFTPPEEIISVVPVDGGRYKYSVRRLFRVYDKLEDCLADHLAILKHSGYADAWPYRNDPVEFAKRIVDPVGAKYATAPNYASSMASMIQLIKQIVETERL
jgi:flagellar protein FlgJ